MTLPSNLRAAAEPLAALFRENKLVHTSSPAVQDFLAALDADADADAEGPAPTVRRERPSRAALRDPDAGAQHALPLQDAHDPDEDA